MSLENNDKLSLLIKSALKEHIEERIEEVLLILDRNDLIKTTIDKTCNQITTDYIKTKYKKQIELKVRESMTKEFVDRIVNTSINKLGVR